jgi:hypothetical protein
VFPAHYDPEAVVRVVTLGPFMALSLSHQGFACLHGSAVDTTDGVVGFVAPKHHGKSTLALVLTSLGAKLVTDDLIAVRPDDEPLVLPGVHTVRLLSDSVRRYGSSVSGVVEWEGKPTLRGLPQDALAWTSRPLAALYLLNPDLESDEGIAARRIPVRAAEAVVALQMGAKVPAELCGIRRAATALEAVARLVESVPVYRLRMARNLDRVPEVANALLEWHSGTPVAASEVAEVAEVPEVPEVPGAR